MSDRGEMGDQDVFRALRGAASAALSNDLSRRGEEWREKDMITGWSLSSESRAQKDQVKQ